MICDFKMEKSRFLQFLLSMKLQSTSDLFIWDVYMDFT